MRRARLQPAECADGRQKVRRDLLDAEITPDGILLRPKKVIDATQAWFWEPTWQAGEREADTDRRAGRTESFESGDAFVAELRALAKPSRRRTRR